MNVYDYIRDSNLFKKFAVDDFLFVEYKCLFPDAKVSVWTSCNYFVYVFGGRKRWCTNNGEYMVRDGEGLFVKTGAYVAEKFYDEDFCALMIFVPDHFIRSVVKKYASVYPWRHDHHEPGDGIVRLNIDESFSGYFNSLLGYFSKSASPPKELLTIKFEELILNILSSPHNDALASHFLAIQENDGKVSVRETMERYFMYNMSIEEYARLCARSLSSFKADFFNLYKTSPGRWLTAKRLEYAKHLIETTYEPVSEVAFRCGFKNTSHFVRVFRNAYGNPPLQHRLVLKSA